MFDFDAGKIIIVGVLALIFIPPKDLPRVMRQVGQFVGKMRRMAAEFQSQFMDAMKEADMADLKREAQKLSDAARISSGLGTIQDLDRQMSGAIERTSYPPLSPPLDATTGETSAATRPHPAPEERAAKPMIAGANATRDTVLDGESSREEAAPHQVKATVDHSE